MGRRLATPLDCCGPRGGRTMGGIPPGPYIYLAHHRGGDAPDFYFAGVSPSLHRALRLGFRASHQFEGVVESLGSDDLAPP